MTKKEREEGGCVTGRVGGDVKNRANSRSTRKVHDVGLSDPINPNPLYQLFLRMLTHWMFYEKDTFVPF
jgi:hypothetical protein